MKSILIFAFSLSLGAFTAQAQEFKVNTEGARQVIIDNVFGKIQLKENGGSELIIKTENYQKKEIPEKAKGLKPISAMGEDNTQIGVNVNISEGRIHVTGVTKASMDAEYLVTVPKGIAVTINYQNPFTSGDIAVDGFSSELEIKTLSDDINLRNVTGPLVLHSVSGSITVDFSTVNQESPISITAVSGEIDVTMPAGTPANLNMSTFNGEVYTDFDLKLERKDKEGLTYIGGGQSVAGQINNGGVEIDLQAVNDNIYLRKK